MNFKVSRLFLLLTIALPALFISSRAGAVESFEPKVINDNNSVNFSTNTVERLNLLVPQNLLAEKSFRRIKQPEFKDVFREVAPSKTLEGMAPRPSAINTLNALLSSDLIA
jgi:hypothetical protein